MFGTTVCCPEQKLMVSDDKNEVKPKQIHANGCLDVFNEGKIVEVHEDAPINLLLTNK